MALRTKKWIVIGGAASAFALAPLAAAAGPAVFDEPMSDSGVVVTAGFGDPTTEAAAPNGTVSPASPQTPGEVDTAASPVSPASAASAPSPVTPATANSPASPRTANSPNSPASPQTPA
jgi:hypothetical protein